VTQHISLRLTDEGRALLGAIQRYYGLRSQTATVELILREYSRRLSIPIEVFMDDEPPKE